MMLFKPIRPCDLALRYRASDLGFDLNRIVLYNAFTRRPRTFRKGGAIGLLREKPPHMQLWGWVRRIPSKMPEWQ